MYTCQRYITVFFLNFLFNLKCVENINDLTDKCKEDAIAMLTRVLPVFFFCLSPINSQFARIESLTDAKLFSKYHKYMYCI